MSCAIGDKLAVRKCISCGRVSPILSVTIPGAFNLDGSVDAADYVVRRKTDGAQEGYYTWRTNFGRTVGGGAVSNATVPEPTTTIWVYPGAALGCWTTPPTDLARSKTRWA
jgi:hypothetical protein